MLTLEMSVAEVVPFDRNLGLADKWVMLELHCTALALPDEAGSVGWDGR